MTISLVKYIFKFSFLTLFVLGCGEKKVFDHNLKGVEDGILAIKARACISDNKAYVRLNQPYLLSTGKIYKIIRKWKNDDSSLTEHIYIRVSDSDVNFTTYDVVHNNKSFDLEGHNVKNSTYRVNQRGEKEFLQALASEGCNEKSNFVRKTSKSQEILDLTLSKKNEFRNADILTTLTLKVDYSLTQARPVFLSWLLSQVNFETNITQDRQKQSSRISIVESTLKELSTKECDEDLECNFSLVSGLVELTYNDQYLKTTSGLDQGAWSE